MFQELIRTNNDPAPRRVALFGVLPVLLGTLIFLAWNHQVGTWPPWAASAATLPASPQPTVTTTDSQTPDDNPRVATGAGAAGQKDSAINVSAVTSEAFRPPSVSANPLDEEAKENNEALTLVTQKLQATQAELAATRRVLEQFQWDVALWKQQAATSIGERDHALREAKDLAEELRQNFLELHVAEASLEVLQKQSAADKERLSQLLKMETACQSHAPRLANN